MQTGAARSCKLLQTLATLATLALGEEIYASQTLHVCYTFATRLLHVCYTFATRLLCYMFATCLLHVCHTLVTARHTQYVGGQWLSRRVRCATRRVTARSKCLVVGSVVGNKAVHNKTEQPVKFYILFSLFVYFGRVRAPQSQDAPVMAGVPPPRSQAGFVG